MNHNPIVRLTYRTRVVPLAQSISEFFLDPYGYLVMDWDFSIFSNTAGLNAYGFSTAVVPETNSAMLNVPARVDLPARLTHETQSTDVGASLTEAFRNVDWARVSDQHGGNILADLTNFARSFEVHRFSPDLVPVLADCCLRNP